MGIKDAADRLKILQQITSMRADLVTSGSASPSKRMRSPAKNRRFSDMALPTSSSNIYRGSRSPRGMRPLVKQNSKLSAKYVNISVQENNRRASDSGTSVIYSPSQLSTDDSRASSRIDSPDKQLQEVNLLQQQQQQQQLHCHDNRGLEHFSKLRTVATLRYHNIKRLSRSLDNLFPVYYNYCV